MVCFVTLLIQNYPQYRNKATKLRSKMRDRLEKELQILILDLTGMPLDTHAELTRYLAKLEYEDPEFYQELETWLRELIDALERCQETGEENELLIPFFPLLKYRTRKRRKNKKKEAQYLYT